VAAGGGRVGRGGLLQCAPRAFLCPPPTLFLLMSRRCTREDYKQRKSSQRIFPKKKTLPPPAPAPVVPTPRKGGSHVAPYDASKKDTSHREQEVYTRRHRLIMTCRGGTARRYRTRSSERRIHNHSHSRTPSRTPSEVCIHASWFDHRRRRTPFALRSSTRNHAFLVSTSDAVVNVHPPVIVLMIPLGPSVD